MMGVQFYQRDRSLVRVARINAKASDGTTTTTPGIIPVTLPLLRRSLGQSALWQKYDKDGELFTIDPPKDVNEQIASMVGEWPFGPLTGVIGAPTLRPDGSLLIDEGYDEATGLFMLGAPKMPAIPAKPTRADAERALALLDGLLAEFPFVDDQSKSVALSMLMTPVLRGRLPPAVPIHLVTKPAAGTGGSYLADVASAVATGERCAVISIAPKPEETEKRLIGAAISGFPIIALDNCNAALDGDFLCQVSERPIMQLRPLGVSDPVRIANSFTIFANGNQASVTNDVVRRTVSCGLDANTEHPEDREFKQNPLAMVIADRGRYIAACLTIARAYIVAGRPGKPKPLLSFERWSDTVRSALIWLDRADPVATMKTARAQDEPQQQRAAVFKAWSAEHLMNAAGLLTAELIAAAEETHPISLQEGEPSGWLRPALHDALYAVAASRAPGNFKIDSLRLAKWLSKNVNNISGVCKLTVDRSDATRPRWRLEAPQ
jgi:putative DNA primase/helicase